MLDAKNKQILQCLFENGRMPVSEIAKKSNTSKDVVSYRLTKLQENNILLNVVPVINYPLLGYNTYRLQLNFTPEGEKIINELIKYFSKLNHVSWITKLDGNWELVILFLCKNVNDFNAVFEKIMIEKGKIIQNKRFTIVTSITHMSPQYLLDSPKIRYKVTEIKNSNQKITETEKKLLTALLKNGRTPVIKLGKQINMSTTATVNALKNLTKKGIIINFKPILNIHKLGYDHFRIMIELTNPNDKKLIKETLSLNKYVVYTTDSLGEYDIEFEAECKSISEMNSIIKNLKLKFNIKNIEMIFNNEEVLVNKIPK